MDPQVECLSVPFISISAFPVQAMSISNPGDSSGLLNGLLAPLSSVCYQLSTEQPEGSFRNVNQNVVLPC